MKKDCLDYGFDLYVAFVDGKPVECGESRILLEKSYSLMLKRASLKRHKVEIKKCFCTILDKPKIDESPMLDFLDFDNPEDEAYDLSYQRYLDNRANSFVSDDDSDIIFERNIELAGSPYPVYDNLPDGIDDVLPF